MATTFVDYVGDGNATKSFSFPSYKESDIKVDVEGVVKTSGSHYNITSYTTTGVVMLYLLRVIYQLVQLIFVSIVIQT